MKKALEQMTKVVVALYNYTSIEGGDLNLRKNHEYEIIDESQEHWWKAKDAEGNIGLIPNNYVIEKKELLDLHHYDWFFIGMSRQKCEALLLQEDKKGCFVVRNSKAKHFFTLSLYIKVPAPHVKHYRIKRNLTGEFFISERHCFSSIPDLINYHTHNSGGLASRLRTSPCEQPAPATTGLSRENRETERYGLQFLEELPNSL